MAAVNADGTYGRWAYRMIRQVTDCDGAIQDAAPELSPVAAAAAT